MNTAVIYNSYGGTTPNLQTLPFKPLPQKVYRRRRLFFLSMVGLIVFLSVLMANEIIGRIHGVPGGSVQIDYTGPILNFNSEEFVPRSAIPAIVNSASRKGASAGSSQVFSQMRNSRSTRSRMAL